MKVVKFGGTSLADAGQILKVVNIVKSDKTRRIVVVSAPGKRFANDIKVTDLLIALANAVLAGKPFENELAAVTQRYAEIQQELDLDKNIVAEVENDIRRRIQGLNFLGQSWPMECIRPRPLGRSRFSSAVGSGMAHSSKPRPSSRTMTIVRSSSM